MWNENNTINYRKAVMKSDNKNERWKAVEEIIVCILILIALFILSRYVRPYAWDGASLANKMYLEQQG